MLGRASAASILMRHLVGMRGRRRRSPRSFTSPSLLPPSPSLPPPHYNPAPTTPISQTSRATTSTFTSTTAGAPGFCASPRLTTSQVRRRWRRAACMGGRPQASAPCLSPSLMFALFGSPLERRRRGRDHGVGPLRHRHFHVVHGRDGQGGVAGGGPGSDFRDLTNAPLGPGIHEEPHPPQGAARWVARRRYKIRSHTAHAPHMPLFPCSRWMAPPRATASCWWALWASATPAPSAAAARDSRSWPPWRERRRRHTHGGGGGTCPSSSPLIVSIPEQLSHPHIPPGSPKPPPAGSG